MALSEDCALAVAAKKLAQKSHGSADMSRSSHMQFSPIGGHGAGSSKPRVPSLARMVRFFTPAVNGQKVVRFGLAHGQKFASRRVRVVRSSYASRLARGQKLACRRVRVVRSS